MAGFFDDPANAGGLVDVATQLKLANQNSSLLIQAVTSLVSTNTTQMATLTSTISADNTALIAALTAAFPQVQNITGGTFTCAASATTTVPQVLTQANSFILLMPTNAAAGTLMGSTKSLFVSARTANTSFAVTTASGVAALGTEQISYLMIQL